MRKNRIAQQKGNSLRQKAEKILSEKDPSSNDEMMAYEAYEATALLCELQIHKIELEQQNVELKRANEKVESLFSKYYDLYERAPFGYITIDETGKILEVNQATVDLFKEKKKLLLNNYLQNYIPEDYLPIYRSYIMKVLESEVNQICKIQIEKKGKIIFHAEIIGMVIKWQNHPKKCMWLSITDITDRIRAEEAKEIIRKLQDDEHDKMMNQMRLINKLKTEYFSNFSHELRTPLNVILSSLKLLELKKSKIQEQLPLKLDTQLFTIRQNSYRLLRLINNIIDMNKIEAGFYEIRLRNSNIVSLVEDITLSVVGYVEDKGIEIIFDTDVEEKVISCDPDKIERIMLNLLSNAVKFNKPGGSITVILSDLGEAIEIAVIDTGVGVPKEKQELIFQRFHQVDPTSIREREGSGIGLSLIKSLVDMHGGTIRLESEYGKGSKFIVSLPAKTDSNEPDTFVTNANIIEQTNIERMKIEFSDIYS